MRLMLAFLALLAGEAAAELDWPVVFTQLPAGEETGGRLVRLEVDGERSILTATFADAADPCVSFDGKRILFAGRREAGDRWDIWEMRADGSGMRRITESMGNCRNPAYLPEAAANPPTFDRRVPWITFVSDMENRLNDQGDGPLTSLYAMSLEPVPGRGVVVWKTTHDLGGAQDPTVMADGRILYASRQRGAFALMTISWAGENLNSFTGSHDGEISQRDPAALADRRVVFVETEGNSKTGRLSSVHLRRPLHSHTVLGSEGRYGTPRAADDGFLVSWAGEHDFSLGLYRVRDGGEAPGDLVTDHEGFDEVDGVPIAPRPVPVGRIPQVDFTSVLDVGELRSLGQLHCMNAYESDRPHVDAKPGEISMVRFVEGIPRGLERMREASTPDSTWPPPGVDTRVLGEAPVEDDGSFYVNVAGDVPFYLEMVGKDGRPVETMRAWMWVRSGDQRGCIGCHENRELSPVNRATQALLRAEPVRIGPADTAAEEAR